MALFDRRKTKEELQGDIARDASTRKAYRQAQMVENMARRLLKEAEKLTQLTEEKGHDG